MTGFPPPGEPAPVSNPDGGPGVDSAGLGDGVGGGGADRPGEPWPDEDAGPAGLAPGEVPAVAAVPPILLLLAVALAVSGALVPLFEAVIPGARGPVTFGIGAWRIGASQDTPLLRASGAPTPVPTGYPLALAAALLVAAVVCVLGTARLPLGDRRARVARVLSLVGTTFLAGAVFVIGMVEVGWLRLTQQNQIIELRTNVGAGFWLLVGATVLAIAAVVLLFARVRRAEEEDAWPDMVVVPFDERPGQSERRSGAHEPVVAVIPNWE